MMATLRSRYRNVHAALVATSDRAITAACVRYGLVLMCEDVIVNGVLDGRPPLALSTWQARTVMSELPPIASRSERGAWAARVRIDVAALRAYALAVYAATDAYFARQPEPLPSGLTARVLSALLLNQRDLLTR
ncbi:MAG TPA: hypothetical protein VGK33_18645 [Chloroflexota bacterium]